MIVADPAAASAKTLAALVVALETETSIDVAPLYQLHSSAVVADWVALRQCQPVSRANAWRQLLAAARFQGPQGAPGVPALLLAGAADALVDPACSQAVARAWGAALRLHPDAGHDLPLDDPDWVIAQVQAAWPDAVG